MLKDQLIADLKIAMKAGDTIRRSTVGLLLAVIKNRELEKRSIVAKKGGTAVQADAASVLTDDEVIAALTSEAKKRREAIEAYTLAGRAETAEQERQELAVIMSYLPAQLSEEEIRILVQTVIRDLKPVGASDSGKVIGAVMATVKGRAEGGVVQRIVRESLGAPV